MTCNVVADHDDQDDDNDDVNDVNNVDQDDDNNVNNLDQDYDKNVDKDDDNDVNNVDQDDDNDVNNVDQDDDNDDNDTGSMKISTSWSAPKHDPAPDSFLLIFVGSSCIWRLRMFGPLFHFHKLGQPRPLFIFILSNNIFMENIG